MLAKDYKIGLIICALHLKILVK